ncbi:MAG TPA: hypothetical protein VNW90_07170 [Acetobacteraceae bacterium]|nr:hypothetical protein [Acetobacteraceae bacterium]
MADIVAKRLVKLQQRSGFVILKRAPGPEPMTRPIRGGRPLWMASRSSDLIHESPPFLYGLGPKASSKCEGTEASTIRKLSVAITNIPAKKVHAPDKDSCRPKESVKVTINRTRQSCCVGFEITMSDLGVTKLVQPCESVAYTGLLERSS